MSIDRTALGIERWGPTGAMPTRRLTRMLTRRGCGFVERNTLTERGLERAGSRVEDDTL